MRKPRLDAPGVINHIIARGIEGRPIFVDNRDKNFFLQRLGEILMGTATPCYAFCLIPNHFHLLLRRGNSPLSTVMRRLLTSHALYFNKRHERKGHLFQNRYKSILCQEDSYLIELVRYIHLNPVRAGFAKNLAQLNRYYISGHTFITSLNSPEWFDSSYVLSLFGKSRNKALTNYLEFVQDGFKTGRRPDLTGGLKIPWGTPWDKSKIEQTFDSRILGDHNFAETLLANEEKINHKDPNPISKIGYLTRKVAKKFDLTSAQILGKGRSRQIAQSRALISFLSSRELGLSHAEIARGLRIDGSAVSKMARKGREMACKMSEKEVKELISD